MTSSFDWSKYEGEESSKPSNAFDWSKYEEPGKKPFRKAARLAYQFGKGRLQTAALPYDLAVAGESSKNKQLAAYRENLFGDIERLLEQKQAGEWDTQDQELLDNLIEQANDPSKSDPFLKTSKIGVGDLLEKAGKNIGLNLAPEDASEHIAGIAGNLVNPKGAYETAKSIPSLFKKGTIEAKKWATLLKTSSKNPVKESMLEFAKSKGLTPEETTLLLKSEGSLNVLGQISKKTKTFKETVKSIKDKLSGNYEDLKRIGRQGGSLNLKEAESLTEDLGKILSDMNISYVEGTDVKGARTVIEEAIQKIHNKEGTVEDLINSRRRIRKSANWKNIDEGDVFKKKAEQAFLKAIERKNPEIGKELIKTDKAYAQYKKYKKLLDKKQIGITWHGLKIPDFAGSIAFGVGLKALGATSPTLVKGYIIKEVGQRLATRLLTDPKFQGIHKRLIDAVLEGSSKNQKNVLTAMKSLLKKEDPDLYEEIKDLKID